LRLPCSLVALGENSIAAVYGRSLPICTPSRRAAVELADPSFGTAGHLKLAEPIAVRLSSRRIRDLEIREPWQDGMFGLVPSCTRARFVLVPAIGSKDLFMEHTKEEKRSTMTTTSIRTLRTRLALPRTTPVEMEDTLRLCAARCMYFSFRPTGPYVSNI
ncbi:hypothetical protein EJB05_56986, partial [Eragrostis curvula]